MSVYWIATGDPLAPAMLAESVFLNVWVHNDYPKIQGRNMKVSGSIFWASLPLRKLNINAGGDRPGCGFFRGISS